MEKGVFIILDGAAGSGDNVQFKLLAERLRAVGHDVEVFDFPRYTEPSSHYIRSYLSGNYGQPGAINAYATTLFYAMDRYEAGPAIRKALSKNKIVLANRYVGSNMARQGAKFSDQTEQRGYFVWADSLEFNLLGNPRPSLNIFLRVPSDISIKLINSPAKNRQKAVYTQPKPDEDSLEKSLTTYDTLCRLFPKDFCSIDCTEDGELLGIPAINDKIWQTIQPLLPDNPAHAGRDLVVNLNDNQPIPVPSDKNDDGVAQHTELQPPADLEARVKLELNDVSFLALAKILASNNITLDYKSTWQAKNPGYRYYKFGAIDKELNRTYRLAMDELVSLNRQIADGLKNYLRLTDRSGGKNQQPQAAKAGVAITPLAALTNVSVIGQSPAIGQLISVLDHNHMQEARWLGGQLSTLAAKMSIFDASQKLSANDTKPPERLGETIAKMVELLPQSLSSEVNNLQLTNVWPRNEFDLLAEGIYPHSSSSLNEIIVQLEGWTYEQKQQTLTAILAQPNNPVLSQIRYSFDALLDYATLWELKNDNLIEQLQLQEPTPRYGYDVPQLIEDAGLEESYTRCFDLSLELFSAFQTAGREDLAGYSTLLGHKVRCQFSITADNLAQTKQGEVLDLLKEKVGEVHPLIGAFLLTPPKQPSTSNKPAAKRPRRRHRRPNSRAK